MVTVSDSALPARLFIIHPMHTARACTVQSMKQDYNARHQTKTPKLNCLPNLLHTMLGNECTAAMAVLYTYSIMGWRLEACSSSDVGQWSTALRQLAGDFAISATSVECYGLSHMCFCLQLSSNVTTRVWIDNLYHIKPAKYHGVGTLVTTIQA